MHAYAPWRIAPLWVLLFSDNVSASPVVAATARALAYNVFPWTEQMLFAMYPRLGVAAGRVSAGEHFHFRRYYWFHASIGLWRRMYDAAGYEDVRYWWRLEPDVVFTAPLSVLVEQYAPHVDALLLDAWSAASGSIWTETCEIMGGYCMGGKDVANWVFDKADKW